MPVYDNAGAKKGCGLVGGWDKGMGRQGEGRQGEGRNGDGRNGDGLFSAQIRVYQKLHDCNFDIELRNISQVL